ncbi:hydroxymethylbilane synthase [Iamia sp. SCSIO 61187]|uniref:hydroxymethylbilane synthase n=1 Tax=Iamia sp. SCSIO 61187 TaxID=2722752 RepID=UPI001C624B16|nr:hydroxymethylbilane synthase [Iamia sp. SCSIO 61187]QYG94838.1 hydroxymethylbilane synthase [Iamia sp. SCSIO 61187]
MKTVRLATRSSPLALWQAEHVADLLRAAHPGLEVTLVRTDTLGDRRLDVPISEIGGKGVFATEVQRLVLDGDADAAVHSAKDLPAVTGEGLALAAVPERGDPRDALVGATLDGLAAGATVATGSQRRRVQLATLRPDLVFTELRGNMATRLGKVPAGGAIVVAAVALQRLGWADRIDEVLGADLLIPQVGQAALAVEGRAGDAETAVLLAAVEHGPSRTRVDVERAFLAELGGDCDLPAGAHATLDGDRVHVQALLAGDDGTVHVEEAVGPAADGESLARGLAQDLRTLATA